MASYNLSELFEVIVDASAPDREALVVGDGRRLTYRHLDERATRLANHLREAGIGRGDHIGLQLLNGSEYVEAMLAAFKLSAVPVNVNYRYVEKELAYLYGDADLKALLYHRSMAPRVAAAAPDISGLDHFIHVDDEGSGEAPVAGSVEYEAALAAASPERTFSGRSSDDVYIAYTGGTTGMPKGVMWRCEDIFFGAMGGGDVFQTGDVVSSPDELATRMPEAGLVILPTPPFMHVSAHWGAFMGFFGGGKVVIVPHGRFDPGTIWSLVDREAVNILIVVGDAMAVPLADEFDVSGPYGLPGLIVIGSGGAVLSPTNKERLAALKEGLMIIDGMGSSEMGAIGTKATAGGEKATGPQFAVNAQTAVLDDDLRRIEPGSDTVGQLARTGHIPLGYYGDVDKTATTFVTDPEGTRWALAGDMAQVAEDGTVVLLGRGSVSINSGGEKVYPEEVEVAVRHHPAIADVLVVGVPDDRWGSRVVAVASLRSGESLTLPELESVCRDHLAGYKVPRHLIVVDEVVRSPSGKADYRWAKQTALDALGVGGG